MTYAWLALVPPLIVVVLATVTRRILFSLMFGIIASALIINDFALSDSVVFIVKRLWSIMELYRLTSWDAFWGGSNIFICGFLLLLGFLIALIQVSGAAYAYANFVARHIKSARGSEFSSLLLSSVFFIDDYFSCLTVGSVMQPVTDRFLVPRAKLALLVSIIAAPLALIVPMSSWVAEITGQFRNAGIGISNLANVVLQADPLYIYLLVIPSIFYALIAIVSLWFMVARRISFGVVRHHERRALADGNLFGGKIGVGGRARTENTSEVQDNSLFSFIFPITFLFISMFFWIAVGGSWSGIGGKNELLRAIQEANIFAGLFFSGVIACCATTLFYLVQKKIIVKDLFSIAKEAVSMMGGAVVMLVLIWTLSSILSKDLKTGTYLAENLLGHINISLLPTMFFILAALISSLIGTSWGTIGMLIPLAVSMIPSLLGLALPFQISQAPILIPVLGAIISGSLVGNHMSPIADMMLMAATSAGAHHLDVVKSLISFALPTAISSLLSFYIVGKLIFSYSLLSANVLALSVGIASNILLLSFLHVLSFRCTKKL